MGKKYPELNHSYEGTLQGSKMTVMDINGPALMTKSGVIRSNKVRWVILPPPPHPFRVKRAVSYRIFKNIPVFAPPGQFSHSKSKLNQPGWNNSGFHTSLGTNICTARAGSSVQLSLSHQLGAGCQYKNLKKCNNPRSSGCL